MALIRNILLFCLMIGGFAAVAAMKPYDRLEMGLKSGDKAPELKAISSQGVPVNWRDIMGEKGAIVLFIRSADWCPYCKSQLKDWNKEAERFTDAGYRIAAISYDSTTVLQDFGKTNDIRYNLLSDTNSKTIKSFGLLNNSFDEGTRYYGIPHPAIYVIEPDGTIAHRFTGDGYKKRPPIDLIAQELGLADKPPLARKE
jgi:peroxiredoxin